MPGMDLQSDRLLMQLLVMANSVSFPSDLQEEGAMFLDHQTIDLGKVVVQAAQVPDRHHSSSRSEKAIRVTMNHRGVAMNLPGSSDAEVVDPWRVSRESGGGTPPMTTEQVVELGQLLLKAGELQPKYAADVKRLIDEYQIIVNRYKDLASGVGLDSEVDIDDDHSTITTRKMLA